MNYSLNISRIRWQWLHRLSIGKRRSNASLYMLSNQIHHWNIARITSNHLYKQAQTLSVENVCDLRKIIHTSVSKTAIEQPEIIVDQLLFLVIGAIQIESQNGSNDAWLLVNRAIQKFAVHKYKQSPFWLSLAATLLALGAYTEMKSHSKSHSIFPSTSLAVTASNAPDPVTISMLELTYHKMKAGTCQLPQAAMLPPEQRHAFLMFVNEGTVDVRDVDDLRQALGYVNCLYPQELMHPTPA